MIHTTVVVMTVGGAVFTFHDNDALSAERSIMNGWQIDAVAEEVNTRIIIPFESIDAAGVVDISHTENPEVEDDNCVVRTPAEDSGDDEGGRD